MLKIIYMRKVWKAFGMLAAFLATIGSAMAWGYGYNGDCQNYVEITNEELKQKAEEVLKSVIVEERYSYRYDTTQYVLLKDDKTVGIIWEKVDLSKLSIGSLLQTDWGVKAELIYNGNVVGQLYLEGTPTGWQNGQNNYGICDGSGFGQDIQK